MRVFISGGCKNGKSTHAQRLAKAQCAPGKPLYYLATMVPKDAEDLARIKRHQEERLGWGFETVEVAGSLMNERMDKSGSILLDSVTALLSDGMFLPDGTVDLNAHLRLEKELLALVHACPNIVIVSDGIYSDAWRYDELTEDYRKRLAYLDCALAHVCDTVLEAAFGSLIVWKGGVPHEMG